MKKAAQLFIILSMVLVLIGFFTVCIAPIPTELATQIAGNNISAGTTEEIIDMVRSMALTSYTPALVLTLVFGALALINMSYSKPSVVLSILTAVFCSIPGGIFLLLSKKESYPAQPYGTAPLNLRGCLRQSFKKFLSYMRTSGMQNIVIVLATIVLFVLFTLINPSFASSGMLLTMSKSLVPYAILALGVTFVIATGGIDLSIGTVCIGSAVFAGAICKTGVLVEDGMLWLTIPIILLTGLAFGLINGLLVAKCKIAPFIATLGTMLVSRGLTSVISEAVRETSAAVKYPTTGWFQKIFTNLNGFPIGIIWVLVLTAICMVVMYKTKVGRYILAIGSNEEATRLSGINVDKYKIIAYAIGGFFAGLAALFYVASNPSLTIAGGNGMELDAIAGVYIGGTSTTGGSASIVGTLLGSIILVVIRQGLNMALAGGSVVSATNITYAVTGVIVVGAVLLDVLKKKAAAKVKIEKPSDKLLKETKEKIEELQIERDYALSAKGNPEAEARLAEINAEIATLKQVIKVEIPVIKAEEKNR